MHTETDDNFAGSCNEMVWQSVDESRLPAKIQALKFAEVIEHPAVP
jgi:hypothetical protein